VGSAYDVNRYHICLKSFIFDFEPQNRKMPPISSFFGRQLVWNSFFLFAGTFLNDEKIHCSAAQSIFRNPHPFGRQKTTLQT
jgi:hypothetical protein